MSLEGLDWRYRLDEAKEAYYNTTDALIIAKDTPSNSKQFAVIPKGDLYLLKDTDIHAYEVLLTHNRIGDDDDRTYKLYFDTEIIIKDATEDKINAVNIIRQDFIKAVLEFFKKKFEIKIFEEVLTSDAIGGYDEVIDINASGITEKGYKLSYHTILPIYLSNYSLIYDLIAFIIKEIAVDFEKKLANDIKDRYIIDRSVYTSNPTKSRLFRLPYQTKITAPNRPLIPIKEGLDYLDYLITCFDPRTNITKTDLIEKKIVLKVPKNIQVITNNARTILDLNNLIKSPSQKPITSKRVKEVLMTYPDDEQEALVRIYLESIINTPEHRQTRIIWLKVITNLKILGKDYTDPDYFKQLGQSWTISAYAKNYKQGKLQKQNDIEVKEAVCNFERSWDSINIDNFDWDEKQEWNKSFLNLQNYAVKSDKELPSKILINKGMIKLYNFRIPNGIDIVQSSRDIDPNTNTMIDPDFIPYIEQQSLTTKEGIGRGKTKAVLKIVRKYCRPHNCPRQIKEIKSRYEKGLCKAKTDEERRVIKKRYDDDIRNCPQVVSRYIIFSNRVLFGEDFKAKLNKQLAEEGLKPAYFYLDNIENEKVFLDEYSGIVVSIESLYKNRNLINRIIRTKNYFTFFDEIETLLCSLTGNTRSSNEIGTMTLLKDLWNDASINICADAYLSVKSMEFIQGMNKITGRLDTHTYLHSNDYNPYPKTFNICMTTSMKQGAKGEYYQKAIDDLKDQLQEALKNPENRICILCEEVAMIHQFRALFIELAKDQSYNFSMDANYIEHTGEKRNNQSDEEYQYSLRMFRDPTLFLPIRVWIYNTCIMNGVSVENVKFNCCYAILDNFGTTKGGTIKANDILNAIGRARKSDEWNIYIYNNPFNNTRNIILDNQGIREAIMAEETAIITASKEIDDLGFDGVLSKKQKTIRDFNKYNTNTNLYYKVLENNIYKFYKYDDDGMKKISSKYFMSEFKYDEFKSLNGMTEDKQLNNLLMSLKVNSKYEINLNLIFKKDIFIELATLKGNIINDLTDTIKTDLESKDDFKYKGVRLDNNINIIDTPSNKRLISCMTEIFKNTITSDTEYYERLLTNEANRRSRKVFKNLYDYATDNNKNSEYRPMYVKEVIKILRCIDGVFYNTDTDIYPTDLPKILTTTDIKTYELESQFKNVLSEYNNYNQIKKIPTKLITNINNILYPIGLKYEELGTREREKTNNKDTNKRGYIYTYELVAILDNANDNYERPLNDPRGIKYLINNTIDWTKAK
jgi:hypothetical protein